MCPIYCVHCESPVSSKCALPNASLYPLFTITKSCQSSEDSRQVSSGSMEVNMHAAAAASKLNIQALLKAILPCQHVPAPLLSPKPFLLVLLLDVILLLELINNTPRWLLENDCRLHQANTSASTIQSLSSTAATQNVSLFPQLLPAPGGDSSGNMEVCHRSASGSAGALLWYRTVL